MKIVRSPRTLTGYVTIDNRLARDRRLSWRARGILVYLLSQPDGWETNSTRLAAEAREGRDAVRAGLAELATAGYLTHHRIQDPMTGRWRTDTVVRDVPEDGYPGVGNPDVGFPGASKNNQQEDARE